MKALVTGASGFVGRRLLQALGPERAIGAYGGRAFPGGVRFDAAQDRLSDLTPNLPSDLTHVFILHGAVDPQRCARDWDSTAAINVESVVALAQDCFAQGLTPVWYSTDYVFSGERGFWREDDPTAPLTAYGRQKAMMEAWFRRQTSPWLVMRLSKVVSDLAEPQNILSEWIGSIGRGETMRCAYDQVLSPIDAEDVAGASIALTQTGATGLFNLAGPETFTRLALLQLLVSHVLTAAPDTEPKITPCRLADIGFSEPRPLDTSLDIGKLQRKIGWRFKPMSTLCSTLAAGVAQGGGAKDL